MKIRLILLTLVGIVIYIFLATFHSNMVKEASKTKEQETPVQIQPPAQEPLSAEKKETTPPVPSQVLPDLPSPQEEAVSKSPEKSAADQALQPDQAVSDAPAMMVAPALPAPEVKQLQADLKQRDVQIRQLLDAQKDMSNRYKALLDAKKAEAVAGTVKDQRLEELLLDKETTKAELGKAIKMLQQLRLEMEQLKTAEAQAKKSLIITNAEQIKALAAEKKKLAAELQYARKMTEQLQTVVSQTESALKEKENIQQNIQADVHKYAEKNNQLKAQLEETVKTLATTKVALQQAEHKVSELIRQSMEKEQLAATLRNQQTILEQEKAATEQRLSEKSSLLEKSHKTIQTLQQEIAKQPQAIAAVQLLLDERNQEFDQLKQETTTTMQQLHQQMNDATQKTGEFARERDRLKLESAEANKRIEQLDLQLQQTKAAQTDADKKLTSALENEKKLQAELNEKTLSLKSFQAQATELTSKNTTLHNERLGLSSQLEALQADHSRLLAEKASFEGQKTALAKAENRLKEMATLQVQLEQTTQTLAEKTTALDKAAKQEEELQALQTKHAELNTQMQESRSALTQLEEEKSALAAQLAATQAARDNVETLKKTIESKNTALTDAAIKIKELTAVSAKVADLETQLGNTKKTQQATEKRAAECEQASKMHQESLSKKAAAMQTLENQLRTAQNRVDELTDTYRLKEQQDLVPNLKQQIATLRNQVVQLETAATRSQQAVTEATATVQAKNEEVTAAHAKTQALQAENEKLLQTLQANQEMVDSLKKQLRTEEKQTPAPVEQSGAAAPVPAAAASASIPDADKDGISDADDLCADTPAGTPVNALGCPSEKAIILEGVTFQSGTAALTPESQKILDKTADILNQNPQVTFEVAGYTDSMGNAQINLSLSDQRAKTVAGYLVSKGVAASRLTTRGYGSENPLADNATAAGRQKNRRVELHLTTP